MRATSSGVGGSGRSSSWACAPVADSARRRRASARSAGGKQRKSAAARELTPIRAAAGTPCLRTFRITPLECGITSALVIPVVRHCTNVYFVASRLEFPQQHLPQRTSGTFSSKGLTKILTSSSVGKTR
jgi:hypothetical protein